MSLYVLNVEKHSVNADPQDGCKDIKDTIKQAIALGVVGCNIEDANCKAHKLRTIDDSVHRIKLVLEAAKEAGVPEFAINARVDALSFGGTIDNAIERRKAYLAAGANTVSVWEDPSSRGISRRIKKLVGVLDGRVNDILKFGEDCLTVAELREIEVARISVGPGLFRIALNAYKEATEALLGE
ncbi:hypothetical protein BGZ46_000339 [Entomortierella lignicola]|nr:hypothetical protein BGZ46_000339 [Entomortierella lignicola]